MSSSYLQILIPSETTLEKIIYSFHETLFAKKEIDFNLILKSFNRNMATIFFIKSITHINFT